MLELGEIAEGLSFLYGDFCRDGRWGYSYHLELNALGLRVFYVQFSFSFAGIGNLSLSSQFISGYRFRGIAVAKN